MPAGAYDLQFRQNGTNFSPYQLRGIFNVALPAEHDRQFPEQRWTTYLLLDAHGTKALVAITLGLSRRIGLSQALLPVGTFNAIEPLPRTEPQEPLWQQRMKGVVNQYARLMLNNRSRIMNQR